MTTNAASSGKLVDLERLLSPCCITIMRDGTDAADSIPLVMQLTRTLITTKLVLPEQVLILTTRTRASFTEPTPHVHPNPPRPFMRALAKCKSVDPHPQFVPKGPSTPGDAMQKLVKLIDSVIEAAPEQSKPRVVVIECLHSLRFAFAVDPSAFIRTLITLSNGLSVILAAPIGCGIDHDLSSITYIADNVIDLRDLRTGTAADIDGLITVSKNDGRWLQDPQTRRYKITDNAFNIST